MAKAKTTRGAKAPVAGEGVELKEDQGEFAKPHADKVAEAAYFKSEQRNFEPGHELDDWLEAEREIGA